MQNSKMQLVLAFLVIIFSSAYSRSSQAQQQAQGFAVERLYPSAPGGGWFVMDSLDMHGELGGAVNFTIDHAHNPLVIHSSDGTQSLAVVSDQEIADVGLAATYDRYRIYLNLSSPAYSRGDSGTIDSYAFTGPAVDFGSQPDTLLDMRIGFDARIFGEADGPFRLGAGAQFLAPSGNRSDYESDGNYRGMARLLVAGDVGSFTYSGQAGIHIRPLQDSPTPGSPQGNELIFGVAGGEKFTVGKNTAFIVGPEIYGASAFQSFWKTPETALEWLVTSRLEWTESNYRQIRTKLGVGAGISPQFGAPEWRVVLGLELSGWVK